MKRTVSNTKNVSLDVNEALIALSIAAATNPATQLGVEKLKDLQAARHT